MINNIFTDSAESNEFGLDWTGMSADVLGIGSRQSAGSKRNKNRNILWVVKKLLHKKKTIQP